MLKNSYEWICISCRSSSENVPKDIYNYNKHPVVGVKINNRPMVYILIERGVPCSLVSCDKIKCRENYPKEIKKAYDYYDKINKNKRIIKPN